MYCKAHTSQLAGTDGSDGTAHIKLSPTQRYRRGANDPLEEQASVARSLQRFIDTEVMSSEMW